jgi:hypothetical protein
MTCLREAATSCLHHLCSEENKSQNSLAQDEATHINDMSNRLRQMRFEQLPGSYDHYQRDRLPCNGFGFSFVGTKVCDKFDTIPALPLRTTSDFVVTLADDDVKGYCEKVSSPATIITCPRTNTELSLSSSPNAALRPYKKVSFATSSSTIAIGGTWHSSSRKENKVLSPQNRCNSKSKLSSRRATGDNVVSHERTTGHDRRWPRGSLRHLVIDENAEDENSDDSLSSDTLTIVLTGCPFRDSFRFDEIHSCRDRRPRQPLRQQGYS